MLPFGLLDRVQGRPTDLRNLDFYLSELNIYMCCIFDYFFKIKLELDSY
jgi:hypothetical protein